MPIGIQVDHGSTVSRKVKRFDYTIFIVEGVFELFPHPNFYRRNILTPIAILVSNIGNDGTVLGNHTVLQIKQHEFLMCTSNIKNSYDIRSRHRKRFEVSADDLQSRRYSLFSPGVYQLLSHIRGPVATQGIQSSTGLQA